MFIINKDNILNFKLHNHLKNVDDIEVNLTAYVDDYLARFPKEESKMKDYQVELLEALNMDLEQFKRFGYVFKGQRYQQKIYADPISYYDLVWDVEVLKETIHKEGLKPQLFSVSQLYQSHISKKQIDLNRLPAALENAEPIILAEFPMIPEQWLILDGNHRIYSRYEMEVKEVLGYCLNRNQHKKAMPMKFHQKLYLFHAVLFQNPLQ